MQFFALICLILEIIDLLGVGFMLPMDSTMWRELRSWMLSVVLRIPILIILIWVIMKT